MESTDVELLPLIKHSGCYTIRNNDATKWNQILQKYYIEDDSGIVTWNDNPEENKLAAITFKTGDINLTITLFTNGTLMIQGSQNSLDIWDRNHHPALSRINKEHKSSADVSSPKEINVVVENISSTNENITTTAESMTDVNAGIHPTSCQHSQLSNALSPAKRISKALVYYRNIRNESDDDIIISPLLLASADEIQDEAKCELIPTGDDTKYPTSAQNTNVTELTDQSIEQTKKLQPPNTVISLIHTEQETSTELELAGTSTEISPTQKDIGVQTLPLPSSDKQTSTGLKPPSTEEEDCLSTMIENIENSLIEYIGVNDDCVAKNSTKIDILITEVTLVKKECESQRKFIKTLQGEQENKKDRKINELLHQIELQNATIHEQKLKLAVMESDLSKLSLYDELFQKVNQLEIAVTKCKRDKTIEIAPVADTAKSQPKAQTKAPLKALPQVSADIIKKNPQRTSTPAAAPNKRTPGLTADEQRVDESDVDSEIADNFKDTSFLSSSLSEVDSEESIDEEFTQGKRKALNADIVIFMDSNRKHIDKDRFHGRGKTKIFRCAEAQHIIPVSDQYDLSKAKHIFISTGTNDVGNRDSNENDICREVDDIVHDILSGAEHISNQYPDAYVYILELPPRRDNYQMKTKRINEKLSGLVGENFSLVQHKNLSAKNMDDDKHIKENDIRFLITNMKEKMKENTPGFNGNGENRRENQGRYNRQDRRLGERPQHWNGNGNNGRRTNRKKQ